MHLDIAIEKEPFLIVTDVHSDIDALQDILLNNTGARYRCSLGDTVGYGAYPNEVLAVLDKFDVKILGNHDQAARDGIISPNFSDFAAKSLEHTLPKLNAASKKTLESFIPFARRKNIMLFHGTPESNEEYLFNEKDITEIFRMHQDIDLFFGGHLHIPRVVKRDKITGEIGFEDVAEKLSRHFLDTSSYQYLVNVPSASYARMNTLPGFAVLYHENSYSKVLNIAAR